MISGRGEERHRGSLWRTGPGLLTCVGIVVAAGVLVGLLAVKLDVLEGLWPAGRKTAESPGRLAERLSSVRSPFVSVTEIGRSVEGRPINAIRVGMGSRMVVVAGAIHGSEGNTTVLVEEMAVRLVDDAESLPRDVSLFLVPGLNPDGLAKRSRYNARGVDLNRNWDTSNWRSDEAASPDGARGTGGSFPFSEPETAAFSSWLLSLRDQSTSRLAVILYHSACPPKGLVQPGYRITGGQQETDPNAAKLGNYWANRLGCDYTPTWPEYSITGEAIHWCAENEITCIDIELPRADDPTATEVQLHLSALLDMIRE
jgi:hypothetical protein